MAVLFLDGFETQGLGKWEEIGGNLFAQAGQGRFGGVGLNSGNFTYALVKWLPNTHTFSEVTGGVTTVQLHIDLSAANIITVYRGAGTSNVLGAYTHPLGNLNDNIYRHYQAKVTFAGGTGGRVELKMNGVTILTIASTNTISSANTYCTKVQVNAGNDNGQFCDDVYIADDTGATNNDFLGDVRVPAQVPNAVGAHSDWTRGGTTHTNNWESVDEIPANGDTDYVASAAAGALDTYGITDLAMTSGSVLAVQWTGYVRKDDAGARTVCPVLHSGGADWLGSNFLPLDSYKYFSQVWNTDPADGASWDISRVNALEIGQKLVI